MSPELEHSSEDALNSLDNAPYKTLSAQAKKKRLVDLATVFFRLGTIAFGGPAAHVAMMDDEVVKRRRWLSRENLLDLMGVTSLLPGPNSTELAIHIGYERAGWAGLFIAGGSFILPAMALVWLLAVVYVQYQAVPQVEWLLYGIKPVIVAVILNALFKLGKKALKDNPTKVAGVVAIAAYMIGIHEIAILLAIGVVVMLFKNWQPRGGSNAMGLLLLPFSDGLSSNVLAQLGTGTAAATTATSIGLGSVFLFFLKIGSVLYGSGYVLLAFLQRDLVERFQWLTSQELLDAVAVGQLTPGPVFTTATFVGYVIAGHGGAIAATVGIFLPAFLLVGLVNPWVSKLRQSPWASGFLDGVNAASLGLMAGVTFILARAAIVDWLTVGMAVLSAIAVFRFKVNPAWLVLAGGAIGWLWILAS